MNDDSEASEYSPSLTWEDYTQILLLNPLTLLNLVIISTFMINIGLIQAQGGVSRIRDDIREHAVEAKRRRQQQEWDSKNQEWIHGWDEYRRGFDDENYAK